jgi:hypothetical protein
MGQQNNMNPYYHESPLAMIELANLEINMPFNNQEKALIAISTPIMSFLKLKGSNGGQNIGFKGNVINTAQNITQLCLILPRLPRDNSFFIVRSSRGSDPSSYKDFQVRRERVHAWLLFLTKWNPSYRNITISDVNLNLLPTNDTIYILTYEK